MTDRQIFKARFKALKETLRDIKAHNHTDYDDLRILCVQLNGFTHTVYYDFGHNSACYKLVYSAYYSNYTIVALEKALKAFFEGYPHECYKHRPKEIVYIFPKCR